MRILSGFADRIIPCVAGSAEVGPDLENLRSGEALWIHDTTEVDPEKLRALIGRHNIVLYGAAVSLMEKLGFDEADSVETEKLEKRESEWDKRGFQSYKGHPLFKGINGGFYSVIYGEDPVGLEINYYRGKRAKILAVEKFYISVFRDRSVIWEYDFDSAKVTCIGGYLDFIGHEANPYRAEVEAFVGNLVSYVEGNNDEGGSYWPEISGGFEFDSTLNMDLNIESFGKVEAGPLRIESHDGSYVGISGERILINGLDNGKINEVWIHPFRLLNFVSFISYLKIG